jgi:hypothetical protein
MKSLDLSGLESEELVKQFAEAAKKMAAAVLNSETQDTNRIFRHMEAIDVLLRSRGREARLLLTSFLDDDDRFVRYYAAQYLLGLVPDRARAIIEWNYKYGFDAIAFDAGMTLYNLDTGVFKPD